MFSSLCDFKPTCQDPSDDPSDMDISDAELDAANIRSIRKEHLLHSRKPTLQPRQRSRLQALQQFRLRDDRENRRAIFRERRIVDSLRGQQRQDRAESIVSPYLERFVGFACGDFVLAAELVEDHVDDGGGVGVDIAADGEDRDAAVSDVERFEVGSWEDGGLGELGVGDSCGREEEVDLLAVGRGRVGEEDDGLLGGHGGWFVWRCVVGF